MRQVGEEDAVGMLLGEGKEDQVEAEPVERPQQSVARQLVVGLLVIAGILATWVGSAEVGQFTETEAHYDKTFFIVYLNNTWQIMCLPLYVAFVSIGRLVGKPRPDGEDEGGVVAHLTKRMREDGLSWTKVFVAAFVSAFFLIVADYCYFLALSMTSAGTGIVLFSLSSIVTYLLSIVVLKEPVSLLKILSLTLSFGGVVMITFGDSQNSKDSDLKDSWKGDIIMAGGACFWALYLVSYKKFVGDPSHTTINVQSTLVGLISVIFSFPVIIILHYTGVERFELPSGGLQIGILVATTFLVFCNNYMFTFGVALTAPGFVTIGSMLAIPASAIVDRFVRDVDFPALKIGGTAAVVLGFLLLNIDDRWLWGKLKRLISRFCCCCSTSAQRYSPLLLDPPDDDGEAADDLDDGSLLRSPSYQPSRDFSLNLDTNTRLI
jgi:drug/metabolite transporter (DMT)-like permease